MRHLFILVALTLAMPMALSAGESETESLKKRIAALEAEVAKLSEIVEGTARPINLARTSLASVNASSVNGSRALANPFYGVLNAFDQGMNVVNGIQYTYWLSGGDASPWIEVTFASPVTVTSVVARRAPRFATTLFFARGGEENIGSADEIATAARSSHGVSRVRLTFHPDGGNTRVDEIRILGYVPPGVRHEVGLPRPVSR